MTHAATTAVKIIFETAPGEVKNLGLDEADLIAIMGDLVQTYTEAGKFDLALAAAQIVDGRIDTAPIECKLRAAHKSIASQVKTAILDYINKKGVDEPFKTAITFWHFSNSNDEWWYCRDEVEMLSGRFSRRGNVLIAKPLYTSDKAETITTIRAKLNHHLIVGWMLSAASFELHNGVVRHRKYQHAVYAAWRTFSNAAINGHYNPFFNEDIGLLKTAMLGELYEYLRSTIDDQWFGLMIVRNGWAEDTSESNEFIKNRLPEMQQKLMDAYGSLAEEIKKLVAEL